MKTPQVIEGLTHEEYAKIDAEHSGVLQRALVSPLAYRVAKDQEAAGVDEDRDCLRLGRAIHTAALEPKLFARLYVCWSGGRRAGKEWDAYVADAESRGATILKEDQLDQAVAMAKAVRSHPIAGPLVTAPGRSELTIVWTHPRTGVLIKCRLDRLLLSAVLLDLKSTRDPKPARFASQAAGMGYHIQMALYSDAVAAAGLGAVATKIVAVQSAAPFDVVVYSLDEELLTAARFEYERALDLIVECRSSGKWPGQAETEEVPLKLPAWIASDGGPVVEFGNEPIGNVG